MCAAMCCVSDKCVGGSKDARAVRPYISRGGFVAREAFAGNGHAKARPYRRERVCSQCARRDKCLGGSKDARAVRPYIFLGLAVCSLTPFLIYAERPG
jgi:hypothetical protein